MSYRDEVRANPFDQRVGKIQTLKAIELGVGDSILDVGCGIGQYTPLFLERFKQVVGLDPYKKYLEEARKATNNVVYIEGYGETFKTDMRFDTISMNNILEHVDDPVVLLENCKKHLRKGGRIIVQVPNANSVTRRLGVLMGLIPSLFDISPKEKYYYGHQRVYFLHTLIADCRFAGLRILKSGGILYKPLPNVVLEDLCLKNGEEWATKFIDALVKFGEDKAEDCACIYVVCE